MTPLPHVALLLRSMEEFGLDQVASILERPIVGVNELIDQAGREIASRSAATC
jgi:hypothetical protein